MANMSYHKFEDARRDVGVCLDSLRQCQRMRKREYSYALAMFQDFLTFCRHQDIIDAYDGERLKEYLEDIRDNGEEV